MIDNFFTTSFSTKRLKTDQSAYETKLTGQYCHIQPESGEPIELDNGAFYLIYNMWCGESKDIKVGDQVIIGDNTYQVREVKNLDMGGQPHMEIILALGL